MIERVLNEPALVVALVLAVLNLIGVDAETQSRASAAIESVLVLVGGLVVRQRVVPARNVEWVEE